MAKIKIGDHVTIINEPFGSVNRKGRVVAADTEHVWVTNLNMPYLGTLCHRKFHREEVRKG